MYIGLATTKSTVCLIRPPLEYLYKIIFYRISLEIYIFKYLERILDTPKKNLTATGLFFTGYWIGEGGIN